MSYKSRLRPSPRCLNLIFRLSHQLHHIFQFSQYKDSNIFCQLLLYLCNNSLHFHLPDEPKELAKTNSFQQHQYRPFIVYQIGF